MRKDRLLVLSDEAMLIRIVEILVDVEYMYSSFHPAITYLSEMGMFGDEEEVLFTPEPVPLRLDAVFLSTILFDFYSKRDYLDSRLEYDIYDYYLSLTCIADKYCQCELIFKVNPNLIFPGKKWIFNRDGIAFNLKTDWDTVLEWAWHLQVLELRAILKGFNEGNDKLNDADRLKEINRYKKMLAYDQLVLSNREKVDLRKFEKIQWRKLT